MDNYEKLTEAFRRLGFSPAAAAHAARDLVGAQETQVQETQAAPKLIGPAQLVKLHEVTAQVGGIRWE